MILTATRCLLVMLCFLLATGLARAPKPEGVDFSGIDAFWRIQSTLAAAREPTQASWDALFATPGYALLEARERRRRALTEAFRIAYHPGFAERPEAIAKRNEWVAYVLPHLQRVPAMRGELGGFRKKLEGEGFLDSATRKAQTLLPAGTTQRFALPPISFVFFAPDGRGYPRLIVDLLHLMQAGERSEAFLAHELFHSFRNRIARPTRRDSGDDLLMAALGNAEDEGLADQLDKSDIPDMPPELLTRMFPEPGKRAYYRTYQEEFLRSTHWVEFAEQRLEEYARDPSKADDIGTRLHGGLPDNGRILGAFMARTIAAESGKDRLLDTVGDPIGFWRAYHRSAMGSEGRARPLSETALKALGELERIYYEP